MHPLISFAKCEIAGSRIINHCVGEGSWPVWISRNLRVTGGRAGVIQAFLIIIRLTGPFVALAGEASIPTAGCYRNDPIGLLPDRQCRYASPMLMRHVDLQ